MISYTLVIILSRLQHLNIYPTTLACLQSWLQKLSTLNSPNKKTATFCDPYMESPDTGCNLLSAIHLGYSYKCKHKYCTSKIRH